VKTKAVRIYGKDDLRLEEFDLPEMKDDEIYAEVISDSICMSSYKASMQGSDHKRIPDDVHINPTIIGHEFSGIIKKVGKKWQEKFNAGDKFSIQPALNYKGSLNAPGYSYQWIGGDATHVLIPNEVMAMDCLLKFSGKEFFLASLAEPMSCVIGAFHANYHTRSGSYDHEMGIKEGGNLAILAGLGPMGLAAIDYALHCDRKPSLMVATDIDQYRLIRAAKLHSPEDAARQGVKLIYVNTTNSANAVHELRSLTGRIGFDDVFVFAPVRQVIEQADQVLGFDGCLNFFAGPSNPDFKAEFNFYNVHYANTHIVGTSGGNTNDMREALKMMTEGKINPVSMITHIGGLNTVIDTTRNLPNIPGGKKLIYTHKNFPLIALDHISIKSNEFPFMVELGNLVKNNRGLWSLEAEQYLLENAPDI
jgi:L-sorbose 1-phosphate reductase